MDLIKLAIPAFFVLIGVELLVAWIRRRKVYRLNDAINDLSCGIIQQVLGIFVVAALAGSYVLIYKYLRFWTIPASSIAGGVALFLLVDMQYYWFHRVSHRLNAAWAAHIVHHQSEEYNLAVALRQSAFQRFFSFAFYLPLAFLGFDPVLFATMSAINTLYQFWIHTRLIKTLGPLEWFLNTPSHHRVHHGQNPKYIDKNYAGILIIWDKMFGTFQKEEEEVVYGVTEPLRSWNPLWANFQYWVKIYNNAKKMKRLRDKLLIWVMPPEWRPSYMEPCPPFKEVTPDTFKKYDPPTPTGLKVYSFFHFVAALGVTLLMLETRKALPPALLYATAVYIVLSLTTLGGLFDAKAWAFWFEGLRLIANIALAWGFTSTLKTSQPTAWLIGVGATSLLSMIWMLRYRPNTPTQPPKEASAPEELPASP